MLCPTMQNAVQRTGKTYVLEVLGLEAKRIRRSRRRRRPCPRIRSLRLKSRPAHQDRARVQAARAIRHLHPLTIRDYINDAAVSCSPSLRKILLEFVHPGAATIWSAASEFRDWYSVRCRGPCRSSARPSEADL